MINEPDERHHPRHDEADSVRVRVLFFGAARESATDEPVPSPARASTARDAFERVLAVYPDLRRFRSSLLVAVNQEYARELDITLKDGDELALFPPVSGGSDEPVAHAGDDAHDFFELTTDPIDVGSVARRVVPRRCGATVTLDGYARERTRGRRTLHLVYEAYAPMALAEMRRRDREYANGFALPPSCTAHPYGVP